MRGYMFRNRWFALLFVCITLAGVTKLVGTNKEQGTIQQAAGQIAAQKAQAEQMTTATQHPAPETGSADEVPFADDEELIDEAIGEDPTPIDETAQTDPADPNSSEEEITVVSREVPGDGQPQQAPTQ